MTATREEETKAVNVIAAARHFKKKTLCSLTVVRCINIYAKHKVQYADNEAFGMLNCSIH